MHAIKLLGSSIVVVLIATYFYFSSNQLLSAPSYDYSHVKEIETFDFKNKFYNRTEFFDYLLLNYTHGVDYELALFNEMLHGEKIVIYSPIQVVRNYWDITIVTNHGKILYIDLDRILIVNLNYWIPPHDIQLIQTLLYDCNSIQWNLLYNPDGSRMVKRMCNDNQLSPESIINVLNKTKHNAMDI